MIHRKTKIVCTLGPATEDDAVLRELILSGMNVARLNFSHGTHETHLNNIRRIEAFRRELNLPIAIMLDTKGPEIRLETFENGKVQLKKGQTFTLVTQSVVGNAERASITYPDLPRDIREGTTILIDDGLVEMTVRSLTAGEIVCIVNNDGVISDRKSVNVPDVDLSMPYLSPKDREDIAFGVKNRRGLRSRLLYPHGGGHFGCAQALQRAGPHQCVHHRKDRKHCRACRTLMRFCA